ncbi:MAG: hypothetical protein QNK23_16745 [Crocinitomicaceae bacterium]|nr:hypothetical protein [Crocinitomicaceae bacterium]
MQKILLVLINLWLLLTAGIVSAQQPAPMLDGNPVKVGIKILVGDIPEIKTIDETFDIDGYLTMSWVDTNLLHIFPEAQDKKVLIYNPSIIDTLLGQGIWFPNLELTNATSKRQTSNLRLEIYRDVIVYVERFQATLLSELRLQQFPFDTQEIKLHAESFGFNDSNCLFTLLDVTQKPSDLNEAWKILSIQSKVIDKEYATSASSIESTPDTYSGFVVEIKAKRKPNYFIWQFFLPLFIVLLATWFIPTLWKTGSSHELVFTMLLTVVMFSFYSSSFLPLLYYNTFLEAIVIVSDVIVLLTLVLVLTRKGGKGHYIVHRWWFIPLLSIVTFLVTIVFFFF